MKNILIIKCGDSYPDIEDKHGSMVDRIIRQSNLPENVFRVFNIAEGEQPYHPGEYMAAIITGSEANVNQRLEWIRQLKDWIITARYCNLPVLGICFGHQIIAEALGGKAQLDENGPHVGPVNIKLTELGCENPLFRKLSPSFDSYAAHAFSIKDLPFGAELLAVDSDDVVEAFRVDKLYGIQFHPEFDERMMIAIARQMKLKEQKKTDFKIKNSYKNQSVITNFLDLALKF